MLCKNCNKSLSYANKSGYCQQCLIKNRQQEKINKWLATGDTNTGVNTTIRGAIREYILQDQNYKCAICGINNFWNNQELHFILDHIDGNAANSCRENVRLICPNCDSQLPTFKSRNKNSARNARREWQTNN